MSVRSRLLVRLAYLCTLMGPCPFCALLSALTLSPLQISIWCTFPTKKRTLCSAISMTARLELGAERERKVEWKGQVGGGGWDRLGGAGEEGLGSTPLPPPHPPNHPLPHPQHLVHAGAVPSIQIPSNSQGLRGSLRTARALRATFRLSSPQRAPKHTPWKCP